MGELNDVQAPSRVDVSSDGRLTDMVIKRLELSGQVAAAKFGTNQPIDDPDRERQQLDQIRQKALAMGVDPDKAAQFFQYQFVAGKMVQRGLFRRWTVVPDLAPVTRLDLGIIRTQLDRLTVDILQEMLFAGYARDVTATCPEQLPQGRSAGHSLKHLDALQRRAPATALTSVCSSDQKRHGPSSPNPPPDLKNDSVVLISPRKRTGAS